MYQTIPSVVSNWLWTDMIEGDEVASISARSQSAIANPGTVPAIACTYQDFVPTPSCRGGSTRKPNPFNSESGMLYRLHRAGAATTRPVCCFVTGILVLIMPAGLLANW